jgi:hypothetical protein
LATTPAARSKRSHASGCNSISLVGFDFAMATNDEWIASRYPKIPEKLHALGVVSVAWNEAENWLFWLFSTIVGLPVAESWVLGHELGDVAISERIRALVRLKKVPEKTIEIIENALEFYDICRTNRNQLTHFVVVNYPDDMILKRRSKKPNIYDSSPFDNSLEDIRRVADEIMWIQRRLWVIVVKIGDGAGLATAGPWPSTLPLPDLLWKPPQPTRKSQPRLRPPSRASRRKAALSRKT